MKKNEYRPLKEILDNSPDFPFKEANWEQLALQLDKEAEERMGFWKRYGWIALWLLPFLLLGGWFWYTLHKANQEIVALKAQLQTNEQTITQETTIQKNIIYQYDTIYRTTIVEQPLLKNSGSSPQNPNPATLYSSQVHQLHLAFAQQGIGQGFEVAKLLPSIQKSSLGAIQQAIHEATVTPTLVYNDATIRQPLTDIRLLAANLLDIPSRGIPAWQLPTIPKTQQDKNPLQFMQPTGFSLGIEGSLIKLLHAPITTLQGVSAGLSADIHFGSNWSMFLGAEYLQHKFEVSKAEDLVAYPMVTPDNEDVFSYLRVSSKYLQIPFGFKYRFQPLKLVKPYVGAGLIARRPIRKNLAYEYLGVMEEYYINRDYTTNSFFINSFRGELGVEFQLMNHWNFYLESTYDADFRQSSYDFEKVKYLNLRAGVLYNF